MNVKVLSKECIKPSIPTPQHLRNYKLSFLDQFSPCSYIPIILFYNVNHHHHDVLKKSLSETLSYYYPLGGRLKDVNSIECNDEGILYMEAQANFDLSKFLENPNISFLNKFLPCKGNCLEPSCNQLLLATQTTTFLCGGIAIGVCMLHKVVDASAMSAFLKTWAKLSHGEGDKELHPDFTSAMSLFPPIQSLPTKFIKDFENFYFQGSKSPMRRFLFDSKAIKALKANTSSESVPFPSKIEALTSFICKRIAVASMSLANGAAPKTLMITHVANLRPRVVTSLPQRTFGNLLWLAFAFYDPLDVSMELPDLGMMLREMFVQLTPENIKAPSIYDEKPTTGIPVPGQFQAIHPGTWSTGLCDCFSDVSNCCITCWCPCITFGQIAEIVDKGTVSCGASGALYCLISALTACGCLYSCFYRTKMRKQYRLPENPCGDCLLHFCCEACALCQEYRELKHRGFDMSIGWQENMDNQGIAMAPQIHGGMTR